MKLSRGDGVVNNRETAGSFQSGLTQTATSGFSSALGIVDKWKQQKDQADIQDAMNQALKKKNDWKASNMARQGRDAQGLTEDYLKFSQETENELGSKLSNSARERFSSWAFQDTEQDKLSVMMHQKKQDDFIKRSTFEEGVTLAEETVRTDARNWQKGYDHLNNSLELAKLSGVIQEEEFESKRTEFTNRFRTEVGKSYYTQDKHEFMKSIDGFGFGEPEIAAYKQKYKNDLEAEERERKSLYSEEARLLYGQKEDMKAQAIANSDTSHFFEGANKLKAMGYKDWARDLEEEGNLYKKTVAFNDSYKNAPLIEKINAAKGLKVGEDLDGSGIQLKANQSIMKEVQRQAKIYNTDPAEYVSPFVQGNNPEEIASSRISLQKAQGLIPQKGYKILTVSEKDSLKGAWEAGDVKQRAQLIQEVSQYGKFAPKALGEMEVEGAIQLAPYLKQARDIELMVAAASDKDTVITEGTYKKADYQQRAQGSKFYKLLTDVQKDFPTDIAVTEKLSSVQKVMVGIGARKLDPAAGPKFFEDNFEVEKDTDKMIYFPKTIEADEVLTRLDKKKQEISDSINISDPVAKQSAKWAVRDYTWINSTTGFVLADKKTGRLVPGSAVDYDEVSDIHKMEVAKKKAAPKNVTATEKVKQFLATK